MNVKWEDHASLFQGYGDNPTCIAKGQLHAMVAIALAMTPEGEELVIETDAGQMFCGREIAYIGLLAGRPALSDHPARTEEDDG